MINKSKLFNIIENYKNHSVLVVGDIILDEYIRGKTNRLSPESPVPVLEVEDYHYILGGAANVAANIVALGGNASIIGVVGDDIHSQIVKKELKRISIDDESLITDSSRPTTLKTRLVAKNHYQLARADRESKEPINNNIEDLILSKVKNSMNFVDVILLSDYAKGVLTELLCQDIIKLALEHNKIVVVDPKGSNYAKYTGAHLLTPNRLESEIATNTSNNVSAEIIAKILFNQIKISNVLVTLGEDGAILYDGNSYKKISAVSTEVFDVTGAGDSLISTIAISIASSKNDLESAIILGNYSAGVAVRKKGTTVIKPEELKNIIEHDEIDEKLSKLTQIS